MISKVDLLNKWGFIYIVWKSLNWSRYVAVYKVDYPIWPIKERIRYDDDDDDTVWFWLQIDWIFWPRSDLLIWLLFTCAHRYFQWGLGGGTQRGSSALYNSSNGRKWRETTLKELSRLINVRPKHIYSLVVCSGALLYLG